MSAALQAIMQPGQQSAYYNTQKAWNEGNKATRQAMLTAAGHPVNDYARAFNFLPQYIRNNLIYQSTRKAAANAAAVKAPTANKPKTKTKPANPPAGDFWWNNY